MPLVGILGSEAYVASFVAEITFQTYYRFAGWAGQDAPLSFSSSSVNMVDTEELISISDILIADGADLRFQPYMLLALRQEKTLFLLNPLSVSLVFFDELQKTANEAGARLIPALPFAFADGFDEHIWKKSNFIFLDYKQQVPDKLSTNVIRNALFLLYYFACMPIRSVYHYVPMVEEYKDKFIHFSLKFENGSGASLNLSAVPCNLATKGEICIHTSNEIIDNQVFLAPFSHPSLRYLQNNMQNSVNEQINCSVAWFLNWFEKKISTLR